MESKIYKYPILIKESYLDFYGHVNNATYLTLFEEARWDIINNHGYGADKIRSTGMGPVVLEAHLVFKRELCLREEIVIESQTYSYEKKIAKMRQIMMRGDEICCTADFVFGLFDTKTRRLVLPTQEWLHGIGLT